MEHRIRIKKYHGDGTGEETIFSLEVTGTVLSRMLTEAFGSLRLFNAEVEKREEK